MRASEPASSSFLATHCAQLRKSRLSSSRAEIEGILRNSFNSPSNSSLEPYTRSRKSIQQTSFVPAMRLALSRPAFASSLRVLWHGLSGGLLIYWDPRQTCGEETGSRLGVPPQRPPRKVGF